MKYKISRQALIDIEGIWLYTLDNWSIEQADRYYGLLMNEIEYITNNPLSGKDYSLVREGYFRSKVKSHFIFYKINQQEDSVEIIRILHEKMDVDSHLNM